MAKIIGFGGSRRNGSYNRALLYSCRSLMPEGSELDIFDISSIPLFEPDQENNPPEVVARFQMAVKESDGVLIVTPEYNFSIPGYIKNAIDSVSRPPERNPFPGKPVALMSASIGMLGGSRAQYHLRQVLVFLDAIPLNKPEVFVTFAPQKFNENMELIDDQAKKFASQLLRNLVEFSAVLKRGLSQKN
ncbi:MAG: NAD(P)H-dependent oxidoreductase [Candidatus Thermoplasmatota archaeon]|nr:NAD(P)H-dependent oxidoreductase [Candidatus Thermoplasmatota archaeon]MCL5731508.1 NAD(P)H-dependent oxidoreductase [Candidatus Thermoplasmatota archaeon]